MKLAELVEKLGGEVCRGIARVRQDQDYVILGRYVDGEEVFTEEGAELAAVKSPAKKAPAKKAAPKAATPDADKE